MSENGAFEAKEGVIGGPDNLIQVVGKRLEIVSEMQAALDLEGRLLVDLLQVHRDPASIPGGETYWLNDEELANVAAATQRVLKRRDLNDQAVLKEAAAGMAIPYAQLAKDLDTAALNEEQLAAVDRAVERVLNRRGISEIIPGSGMAKEKLADLERILKTMEALPVAGGKMTVPARDGGEHTFSLPPREAGGACFYLVTRDVAADDGIHLRLLNSHGQFMEALYPAPAGSVGGPGGTEDTSGRDEGPPAGHRAAAATDGKTPPGNNHGKRKRGGLATPDLAPVEAYLRDEGPQPLREILRHLGIKGSPLLDVKFPDVAMAQRMGKDPRFQRVARGIWDLVDA